LFSAFGATSDKRKGNQFLVQALEKMSQSGMGSKAELVIIGASRPENPPDLGMRVYYMGQLHDEISQVLLYSAADVVVAPSMQENLSNTVMESLACGTPVVAFDIGGMPDMIDHQKNGYLATPFDTNDLADGMMWVLENKSRQDMLSQHARQTVMERYTLDAVANRYLALYQSILK
jgi:glycosyltransferase involved in cell wall biosynthesis